MTNKAWGAPTAAGPIALVGSGEYLPEMADLEASLIEGRPPRYVQLATAAVPDGAQVVERWHSLGIAQAARLGVEAVILPLKDRSDAEDADLARQVEGAGLVYLSGGHPIYLADTLRESRVWMAILEAWKSGAALAGCSAGAMAVGSWVPSLRDPQKAGAPGLGLLPHVQVIPHFDVFAARIPDLSSHFSHAKGVTVLGVDEQTALVGGTSEWVVEGRGSAWLIEADRRTECPRGTRVTTPP